MTNKKQKNNIEKLKALITMPDYLVDYEAFNMLLEKLEKNLTIYGEESKAVQPFTKN